MCFESLVDGDATEKSVRELVADELGSALTDGSIAGVVVLVMVLAGGVGPALGVGAALGAVLAGTGLHLLVLVAGVGLVRWRSTGGGQPTPETA